MRLVGDVDIQPEGRDADDVVDGAATGRDEDLVLTRFFSDR